MFKCWNVQCKPDYTWLYITTTKTTIWYYSILLWNTRITKSHEPSWSQFSSKQVNCHTKCRWYVEHVGLQTVAKCSCFCRGNNYCRRLLCQWCIVQSVSWSIEKWHPFVYLHFSGSKVCNENKKLWAFGTGFVKVDLGLHVG